MIHQTSFPSDSELILAIRTGDEPTRLDAEEQLVQKHNERLHDSITSFLGRKHCNQPTAHADGVLSDTWLRVFSYLDNLKDTEKFVSWSDITGRNVARHHLRSCITGQTSSIQITDDSHLSPAGIVDYYDSKDAAIDADSILAYVYSLSEESGSIFSLRIIEGLDFREIGRRLGKSESAVHTAFYRLVTKIKAKFNLEGFNE